MKRTDENIAYPKINANSNPDTFPDKIVIRLMNSKIAKITVNPPIMIGANQYAQDDLFL